MRRDRHVVWEDIDKVLCTDIARKAAEEHWREQTGLPMVESTVRGCTGPLHYVMVNCLVRAELAMVNDWKRTMRLQELSRLDDITLATTGIRNVRERLERSSRVQLGESRNI